ncbi:recombinase family protein [Bacillus subtilis]|nr:recombinase family protein [Bacillus subtilis]WGD82814.1 recombinase family protein [Bacillus subtilis]
MTEIATGIKNVAMYLRISQEKKGENVETLANHESILKDFANRKGYVIAETFKEVLSGGASELQARPQLQRLLDNLEKFDAILVVELSRLSRNGLISETVLQYCKDYDKPIITPEKVYDLSNNDNDVLTFRFGALIASQEHSLIGKRSKNNKITMAKAGLDIAGGVPFGYRRNKETKKLEIYEPEAETIRYIFKLHSQGLGSFKIRDILNEEGIKPARGNHWNLPAIKRIIRNEKYKGWNFFNDRKRVKKNGKWTYEIVDTITVKDAHPPIIPPEEWDNANIERERRAKVASRIKHKKTVSMVSDLLYCGIYLAP